MASRFRFSVTQVTTAVSSVFAMSAASFASTAVFVPLGDLPGGLFESQAFAVSDDGETVVGLSFASDLHSAVRWRANEGFVALNVPRGWPQLAYASGISGDGSIITGSGVTSLGLKGHYAALYWDAALTPISLETQMTESMMSDTADASADAATIIGNDMVGWDFEPAFMSGRAFVLHPGGPVQFLPNLFGTISMTDVSVASAVSADGSVVVGSEDTLGGSRAVRWVRTSGTYTPLLLSGVTGSFGRSMATAVSPDGSVIIGEAQTALGFEPFRWTQATGSVSLGIPPGDGVHNGTASALSADGSVIAGSWAGGLYPWYAGNGAAFIWDARHGIRDLKTLLETEYGLVLTGWRLTYPADMTPDGRTLVGTGINPAGRMEAWLVRFSSPTPGDLNGDGDVDGLDLAALLASWGSCRLESGCCPADFDCNGVVNGIDLATLLAAWG